MCDKQAVTKWKGDILSYKETLKSKIMKDTAKLKKANKSGMAKR